jgi:hypothetical protein
VREEWDYCKHPRWRTRVDHPVSLYLCGWISFTATPYLPGWLTDLSTIKSIHRLTGKQLTLSKWACAQNQSTEYLVRCRT